MDRRLKAVRHHRGNSHKLGRLDRGKVTSLASEEDPAQAALPEVSHRESGTCYSLVAGRALPAPDVARSCVHQPVASPVLDELEAPDLIRWAQKCILRRDAADVAGYPAGQLAHSCQGNQNVALHDSHQWRRSRTAWAKLFSSSLTNSVRCRIQSAGSPVPGITTASVPISWAVALSIAARHCSCVRQEARHSGTPVRRLPKLEHNCG